MCETLWRPVGNPSDRDAAAQPQGRANPLSHGGSLSGGATGSRTWPHADDLISMRANKTQELDVCGLPPPEPFEQITRIVGASGRHRSSGPYPSRALPALRRIAGKRICLANNQAGGWVVAGSLARIRAFHRHHGVSAHAGTDRGKLTLSFRGAQDCISLACSPATRTVHSLRK